MAQAQAQGIIETTAKQLRILAGSALQRLGYEVKHNSNYIDEILARDRFDERTGGRVVWRHDFKVVLRWDQEAVDKMQVTVQITEAKGSGTLSECQKRCAAIITELRKDALRARELEKSREKSTAYGSARWCSEEDLRAADYLVKTVDSKRLLMGKSSNGEYIQIPERSTHAHAIVCGRTGVGKSRGFFIPQLIERTGSSMIVTEATPGPETGELYELTSGWRKNAGHNIYCFNLSDLSSHRINPIDRVRQAPGTKKMQAAERLADLIILNGEREGSRIDPTWDRSEKLLLVPLILHAAAEDPQYGHMGALRWLLLSGADEFAKHISKQSVTSCARGI